MENKNKEINPNKSNMDGSKTKGFAHWWKVLTSMLTVTSLGGGIVIGYAVWKIPHFNPEIQTVLSMVKWPYFF
jgi:hypothetical protein